MEQMIAACLFSRKSDDLDCVLMRWLWGHASDDQKMHDHSDWLRKLSCHISWETDSDLAWLLQNILQMIIINFLCSCYFVCTVPSAGPVVDVQQISGSSVDLSWRQIPVEQTHGFIQGYTVSYSSANQSVRREWSKHLNLPRLCRPHVWIQTCITWTTRLRLSPCHHDLSICGF